MAETALALIPLFNHIVEDIHYFKLAKDFGTDLQSNMILLENSALRLSRWGKTVGLTSDMKEVTSLEGLIAPDNEKQALRTLTQINDLMKEAKRQSQDLSTEPEWYNQDVQVSKLCRKMHDVSMSGRKLSKSAKWALVSKEHFEDKIKTICNLTHDLELYPGMQKTPLQAAIEDVNELGLRDAGKIIQIIKQYSQRTNELLEDALDCLKKQNNVVNYTMGDNNSGLQNVGDINSSTFSW